MSDHPKGPVKKRRIDPVDVDYETGSHHRAATAALNENRILIERRQIVAEVVEGEGEHPMLCAAFMAASDAIADSLTNARSSDRLEFVYGDFRFTIGVNPANSESTE